ncbi:MAG TPA: patatin-like phospholipase family protein [Candidatus Nitrosotenuis sp.]|jgi:patatin-like phospholipase/acyl hydrolase|nr:patatin-like phospholipase family protein [Candidatus Nitrosotenuis sp.]
MKRRLVTHLAILLGAMMITSTPSDALFKRKAPEYEKCYGAPLSEGNKSVRVVPKNRPVVIVSIDGGGVRGVVPTVMIKAIEEQLGTSITKIGNVFAGTSAGSIIIGLLNVQDEEGNPRYSAAKALELSTRVIKDLFHNPLKRSIRTLGGLVGSKYSTKPLEAHLQQLISDARLGNTINPVVITSVDMKTDRPVLFTTFDALRDPEQSNIPLWMAIRASTAAPTYFKPLGCEMKDKSTYALGDGGLVSNNPEFLGLLYAKVLYPDHKYIVVSLATGKPHKEKRIKTRGNHAGSLLRMLKPTIESSLDTQSTLSSNMMNLIMKSEANVDYYRIDVEVPKACAALDNASDKNLKCLVDVAQKRIQQPDFKSMVQALKQVNEMDTGDGDQGEDVAIGEG